MPPKPTTARLVWFRKDLRVRGNPALAAACLEAHRRQQRLIAAFVVAEEQWRDKHYLSPAAAHFTVASAQSLRGELTQHLAVPLVALRCQSFDQVPAALLKLCHEWSVEAVHYCRELEAYECARDANCKAAFSGANIEVTEHDDQCVLPPGSVLNGSDEMYKVFTPFLNKWRPLVEHNIATNSGSFKGCMDMPAAIPTQNIATEGASRKAGKKSSREPSPDESAQKTKLKPAPWVESLLENQSLADFSLQTYAVADLPARLVDPKTSAFCSSVIAPPGELAGLTRLRAFVSGQSSNALPPADAFLAQEPDKTDHSKAGNVKAPLGEYAATRDNILDARGASGLSPYLAVGAVSAAQCVAAAYGHPVPSLLDGNPRQPTSKANTSCEDRDKWVAEIAWRDFYRHILAANPRVGRGGAFNETMDGNVAWRYDKKDFTAWRMGRTGYPLVDAAMRCLAATGLMHNRLRMVTAMFLTKHLLIDWRLGERYFSETLLDADFCSNNGGWQWAASVGTDAAPYFRIMNPFSQSLKFDPDARFIKNWVPELKALPSATIHTEKRLQSAVAGADKSPSPSPRKAATRTDYPPCIIPHSEGRERALAAFRK